MATTAVRYLIRPMVPGDIPQVTDIERESFPSMWPQTTYKKELRNRLARYLVALEEGKCAESAPDEESAGHAETARPAAWRRALSRILRVEPDAPPTRDLIVGFVGLWLMVGEAHIVTIAVRESHRRRGIGEMLLLASIEQAIEHGQEAVTLECRASNRAALAMYEKYGFERVGVRRRYYTDDHEDAVVMTTPSILATSFRQRFEGLRRIYQDRWGQVPPIQGSSIVESP
jgi:ribosomal-protein-alanine N-acetyltransferase